MSHALKEFIIQQWNHHWNPNSTLSCSNSFLSQRIPVLAESGYLLPNSIERLMIFYHSWYYFVEWIAPSLPQNLSTSDSTICPLVSTSLSIQMPFIPHPPLKEHLSANFSPCGGRPSRRPPMTPASFSHSHRCHPTMHQGLSVQQTEWGKNNVWFRRQGRQRHHSFFLLSRITRCVGGQLPRCKDTGVALRRGPHDEKSRSDYSTVSDLGNLLQLQSCPHMTSGQADMTETWRET